jgi:hypothetical protein
VTLTVSSYTAGRESTNRTDYARRGSSIPLQQEPLFGFRKIHAKTQTGIQSSKNLHFLTHKIGFSDNISDILTRNHVIHMHMHAQTCKVVQKQCLQNHTRPELVENVPAWHRLQATDVAAPGKSPAVTCAVPSTCTSQ